MRSSNLSWSNLVHQQRWLVRIAPALVSISLTLANAATGLAQGTAEYAGASGTVGVSANKAQPTMMVDSSTSADNKRDFGHLVLRKAESPAEANRRALEGRAGKDAAKLMLRSVPDKARTLVDGELVGVTPLLLVLAPGRYKVEMEGSRLEHGEKSVDLLPREMRRIVLSLDPRYPERVRLR